MPQIAARIVLTLLLASPLAACNRGQVSDSRIDIISLSEAMAYHERSLRTDPEVLFIDPRRSVIYDTGHIRGAANLRPNDIDLRAGLDPRLESKQALIIYGDDPSSPVARAMAKRLIEAGYNTLLRRRVKFFAGGFSEWQATGLPYDTTVTTDNAPDAQDAKP